MAPMLKALVREARIFLLQALCVLTVLQGEPLAALDRMAAQRGAAESRPAELRLIEPSAALATAGEPPAAEAVPESTALAPGPSSRQPAPLTIGGGEPGIFGSLLAAALFAAPPVSEVPPSPPTRKPFALPVGGPPTPFPTGDTLGGIPVYTGWNLISLPNLPPDDSPAAIFEPLGGQIAEVFTYDLCDAADPWKRYAPGDLASSDLTRLDVERGIWVEATSQLLLPASGALPAAATIPLCPGWNLIGFPAGQSRHPRTVLAPIAGKYQRLYGYDAGKPQPWAVFDPNVPEWASDLKEMIPGRGYWLLATEATTLVIPNQDPHGPDADFTVPADLSAVTKPIDILGHIASPLLDRWTLSSRATGKSDWRPLATGRFPVDGKLGTFDPTLLLNGLYELRLEAVDGNGLATIDEITVSVEGNMKVGHFGLSFVDLEIDVAGIPIQVIRTYDSRTKDDQGDFGYGWTIDIRQGTYRTNGPLGRNWQILAGVESAEGFPVHVPCHDPLELKGHTASVRLSDQEYFRFRPILYDLAPTPGGCFAKVGFTAVSGFTPGATLELVGGNQVFYAGDTDQLVDVDTLALFDPGAVRLKTRDGRIFEVDNVDGIHRIEDANGNRLTITPGAITHSSGLAVAITRDDLGRVRKITDVLGNDLTYEYDGAGDLVLARDREGAKTLFTYSSHHLETLVDPLGRAPIRNTYGSDGRLSKSADAFGKEIRYEHRLAKNEELVTNRLGKSRLLQYDDRGNITKEVDELGNVTQRIFDGADNLLTSTDPLGHSTFNAYDQKNLTRTEDPLGHVTRFTYNGRGALLTMTDPLGHVTTNSQGNLETSTDALGHLTAYSYYPNGRTRTETDALGHTTSYTYDDYGHFQSVTDAKGHQTKFDFNLFGNETHRETTRTRLDGTTQVIATWNVYDRQQRRIASGSPDGGITRTEYDARGQVKATIDALGRRTSFVYDDLGRPVRTTFADGLFEEKVYDAEGRALESRDREGRTTRYLYDDAGRLVATTHPDGAITRSTYDKAGRPVASIDARGKATTYVVYDDAGRRTQVIDALGQVTEFGYDELGNRTSQKDAKGRITHFEYDAAGRQIARILPDGATERSTYDLAGNRTSRTDCRGLTTLYEHDQLNRLQRRLYPGGSEVRFTYTANGRRQTAVDDRGTTVYEYDARDRLAAMTYPDGRKLEYAYDENGNRTGLTAKVGTSTLKTRYLFDELNRPTTIQDPLGGVHQLTYDPNGNRATLRHSNGVLTTYAYDRLNRLKAIDAVDARGVAITGFHYTLGPTGIRQEIAELDGTLKQYGYDDLYRLETESVTVGGAAGWSNVFGYDPLGNRLTQKRVEEGGATRDVAYVYDSRDRLTAEEATSYGWDPNGNLVSKSGPDGSRYEWDFENRLKKAALANGTTVENTYDADGALVRTVTTPKGGAAQVVEYLVDSNGALGQVVLEGSSKTDVGVYYVRGDALIAAIWPQAAGPSLTRSYHADGLGSIRALTDDVGTVTDRWQFEAFGAVVAHSGSAANSLLFAGERLDPNVGWYYHRARWMDPHVGRFASMDPFAGRSQDPESLHKYTYVSANPANLIDPSGETSIGSLTTSMAIGGILGALTVPIANYALGKPTTVSDVFLGAGLGIALTGLLAGAAAVSTTAAAVAAVGVGAYGIHQGGAMVYSVYTNQCSTWGQKVAASVLLLSAIFGTAYAARFAMQNLRAPANLPTPPTAPDPTPPAPSSLAQYRVLHDMGVNELANFFTAHGLKVAREVYVKNPFYSVGRRYDLVVELPGGGGQYVAVEYKGTMESFNNPRLQQAAADGWIQQHGGEMFGRSAQEAEFEGQVVRTVIRIGQIGGGQ